MGLVSINHALLLKMIQYGAINLSNFKEEINQLNVFPVPDGDTGTNMNLSMQSGVKAVNQLNTENISEILQAYVRGLLMGARGNSGVILSQLFKGFADELMSCETEINQLDFAKALEAGVERAYKAVTNPVEGTILTVAKDTAQKVKVSADSEMSIEALMEVMVDEAKASLDRTPDLLAVLKEVGVVDSGGKGLLTIYEGFLKAIKGETILEIHPENMTEQSIQATHDKAVQSFMNSEDIEFGYCTEFFVELTETKQAENPFNEDDFRSKLATYGDSLLVAATDNIVKVHVHTEQPGLVLSEALKYGDLAKIDIENMRKQHAAIVTEESSVTKETSEPLDAAIITIALGSGIADLLRSLGATTVIEGGQTMNPSTEDILSAIEHTNAKSIYILPNNKNIILAANQAKALTDKEIIIIPSKTIPQGMSALFAFDESHAPEENEEIMLEAMGEVKTGQVTFATRNTTINGIDIEKDAYIGLNDDTIIATDSDKTIVVETLIQKMVTEDDEMLTIFFGKDVSDSEEKALKAYLDNMEDIEVEYHQGNQPLYPYLIMVE